MLARKVVGADWALAPGTELVSPMRLSGPLPLRATFKVKEPPLVMAMVHSRRAMFLVLRSKLWQPCQLAQALVAAVHRRNVACAALLLDAGADPDLKVCYNRQDISARELASPQQFQCAAMSVLFFKGSDSGEQPTAPQADAGFGLVAECPSLHCRCHLNVPGTPGGDSRGA
mmetsp:Transcript_3021/g.7203  ORF Transcript_3021/g.7203 Transcript_3021/m.7203 type:complete len:172 (-) Transcript_3021:187-702(-)